MTTDTRDALHHYSDCAVHNAPAFPVGACDCFAGLLEKVLTFIPTQVVDCHGDKCRLSWCSACLGDENAEEAIADARNIADELRSALRTPGPEDVRDAARMQAIAAHPGWLRYLSSGTRKGKWAFHNPMTSYPYDVFDTPQAAIDAALTQPEATR